MPRGYTYGKRSADAEADAWYSPYTYSGNWNGEWMWNNNMMNWNMNWNRNMPSMQEGYRFNYGKRSADPEAFYGPPMYWNMRNWRPMNYYNRPYSFYRYHF